MNPLFFGPNLNKIMKTLGISQIELAKKTGLTRSSISLILTSKRQPNLVTIVKILEVIPVKFERLISVNLEEKIK